MKIIMESTRQITLEELSPNKFYAIFNSAQFFSYHDGELNLITPEEPKLVSWLTPPKEDFYVAEADCKETVQLFFESNRWKNARH